jgi:hypothetical protein
MPSLAPFLTVLATFCCGIFAGASLYINAVEHPARMTCGTKIAFAQWAPSYARATVMQASLAVLGFLLALGAWWAGASVHIAIAGSVLVLVAPFTLLVIMPTNNRLLALNPEQDAQEIGSLLKRWNRLHGVRSALSLSAFAMFLCVTSDITSNAAIAPL